MTFVIAVIVSMPMFIGNVSAYPGGLLHGKALTASEKAAFFTDEQLGSAVSVATDGNTSTFYTLKKTTGMMGNALIYEFDLEQDITAYQILSGRNARIQFLNLNRASFATIPIDDYIYNGTKTNIEVRKNVKYVLVYNTYSLEESQVFEFDVFGTTSLEQTPDTTPPATPTGLATIVQGIDEIYVSWNVNSEPDFKEYVLYRDEGEIYRGTTNLFSDSGLDGATSYSYTVTAVDESNNESAQSAAVIGITDTPPTPTPTPTPAPAPTLKVQSGNGKINISWTAVAGENVIYKLYKNDVLQITTNALMFTDTDVANGTKYTYKIQSVVDEVESDFSASVNAFPTNYVDFGEINNAMPNIIDVLLSAFSFAGKFAPYIVLVLGVMIAAVLVGFILWLVHKIKLNQGEKNERQASGVMDRVYDRLIKEGKEKEAKSIIDRHLKISDRQDREAKALRERVGEPEKNRKAWDDWRQRGRAEHERFEREVRERYEPTVTSGREQREARTGRAGRNDRSR